MALQDAPRHVQIAVDLIQWLELNEVEPREALKALAIVVRDFERKLEDEASSTPGE